MKKMLIAGAATRTQQFAADQEGTMKKILLLAVISEAVAGLALAIYPPVVVRLLCGVEISGVGIVMSRIYGISLIAISIAIWPAGPSAQPFYAMLTYGALVTLYLISIGIGGHVGPLLWPAVLFHAIMTVVLVCAWLKQRKNQAT